MKYLFLFCSLFLSVSSFAQIDFERHPVVGSSTEGSVRIDDVDSDGDLDILFLSYNYFVSWYENLDGQGNFSPLKLLLEIEVSAREIMTGDFDNDGDMDILASSFQEDEFYWYENTDGLGNFSGQQMLIDDVDGPIALSWVDLDGDSDLDILGASFYEEEIYWYENIDGQGNLGNKQVLFSGRVSRITTGDIDNNGSLDILFSSVNDDTVNWLKNLNGQGSFGAAQVLPTNVNGPNVVTLADLDGDGDLDALTNSIHDDRLFWNENTDGLGNFGNQQMLAQDVEDAVAIYARDIDGDGDLDILTGTSQDDLVLWYKNLDGQGNFDTPQVIGELGSLVECVVGDLDGDGDTDVLTFENNNEPDLAWYKNEDGQGNYSTAMPFITGNINGGVSFPHTSDLDGDGDLDVLYASSFDNQIAWSENRDGQGLYLNAKIIAEEEEEASSVYSADLDGDGDLDVISASFEGDKIAWYENEDGLGNFGPQQVIMSNANRAIKVAAFDVDGDGDQDIISALAGGISFGTNFGELYVHENLDGQGTFEQASLIARQDRTEDFAWGDIDGDGDIDLASVSYDGLLDSRVFWYENVEEGFFNNGTRISLEDREVTSVSINDIDSDGDMDIVVSSNSANTLDPIDIFWFENVDGLGDFSEEIVITENLSGTTSIHSADLDGDGDIDILSTSKDPGNPYNLSWFENIDGQANFGTQVIIDSELIGISGVRTADINGDGLLDVLSSSSALINWYKNGGIDNRIIGEIKVDVNADDCESSSVIAPKLLVSTNNGLDTFSTYTFEHNAYYQFHTTEGDFSTAVINQLDYYSMSPAVTTSSFSGIGNIDTVNFCYVPNQMVNNLSVLFIPTSSARAGFSPSYTLVYQNIGTTLMNGTIELTFDDSKIQFSDASISPMSQTNNSLVFEVENLEIFESRTIDLNMEVMDPPTVNFNDTLIFHTSILPIINDYDEVDNSFTLEQMVINSFDPNDMTVFEGKEILLENTDEYLHYLIRFQNTGNAAAINIRVENELDAHLDWRTLQLEHLSHDYRVEIKNGNLVSFIFDDIDLPDSTSNEAASHGFITYKIKPITDIQLGDSIQNTAHIFFDANLPIQTNTVSTKVIALPVESIDVQFSCTPYTWIDGLTYSESNHTATYVFVGGAESGADSIVTLDLTIPEVNTTVTRDDITLTATATDATYQWIDCDFNVPIEEATNASFTPISSGIYAVEVTQNGCTATSECFDVVTVSVNELYPNHFIKIFPNPNQGQFNIDFGKLQAIGLRIRDVHGRLVFEQHDIPKNVNRLPIDLDYQAGVYFLEVMTTSNRFTVLLKIL